MDLKEYNQLKVKDLEIALSRVENIRNSKSKYVRYLDSRPITDIKHMIKTSAEEFADNVAFRQKFDKKGEFESITYKQAYEEINGLGTALIDLGLKDKRICVSGPNCYQWAISYLATVCGTGVVVPLDKELSVNELEQLMVDAEAEAILCSDSMESKFLQIKEAGKANLKYIINFEKKESDDTSLSLFELVAKGKDLIASGDRRFLDAQIFRDEMSILLYTSGTTGISKGVMLSHGNIVEDLMAAPTVLQVNPWDIFFSVLPLHHTYECTCGFLMPLYKGASIAYCQGLKYIQKNLAEVKPTMFLAVPAIFELLDKKIWQNIRAKGKEATVRKMMNLNRLTKKMGINLGNSVLKDITAVFGGRMRMLIVGGAAINPEILQDFRDFGITALQGYGLTECAPMGALNPDKLPKNASAGRGFPGFAIKIINKDENGIGEICLRGGNVMLGYYKNPEATAEVIKDGWYLTGDLGYLDDEGYLFITGRKKNVIITKNGKNVFPEELEYKLSLVPYVAESMVWGDEVKDGDDITIVASIYPDSEALVEKLGDNYTKEDVEKLLWEEVDKINADSPFYKKIKKLIVRDKEFDKNTSKKIRRFSEENKK